MKHAVLDPFTGKRVDLSQEGEIEGFKVGDRVAYTQECYPELRGVNATIIGFGPDSEIWAQSDGRADCYWTAASVAKLSLLKINN